MSSPLVKIRNIGIMAHIDAGKTTVTERVLFFAGRTHKIGEVHDGTTVTDYLQEEQQRGITITSAATSLEWDGCRFNLIDTPGHVDFTVEVERSLRVLDGAIMVLCSVGGVEAQSETVWRQADHYAIPRLCFINKMDRIGADFEKAVAEIASVLHGNPVCLQIPMGDGDDFCGQIDLIGRKAYFYDPADVATSLREEPVPEDLRERVEAARHELVETVAEHDDHLMEKYLGDEPISDDELLDAIRRGTIASALHPVLCGSALKHMGVRPLLDAVKRFLPSPLDVPPVRGTEPGKHAKEITREPDPEAPFCALVFKIISDSHGDLNYIRVYSGTLTAGTRILDSTRDEKENVTRIWEMYANKRIPRDHIQAGDIAAIVGLRKSVTGDTLCDTRAPIILESPVFPEPVISMSIEPETNADKEALMTCLLKLEREDPSFHHYLNEDTGQTVISGMGELHLEVIKNKIVRDFKLNVRVGKPRVTYRETVLGSAEEEGVFDREIGGKRHFAAVRLRVEAAEFDESGFEIEDLSGDAIPDSFIPSVKEGIADATTSGPQAGYPMQNIRIVILGGTAHPEDSSDVSFRQAAALAFDLAVEKAEPAFLEPIMKLGITTPEEYFGAVTGDVTAKRGVIRRQIKRANYRILVAEVPLMELFGYTTQLRSLTQGRGNETMEPLKYAPVPPALAKKIFRTL